MEKTPFGRNGWFKMFQKSKMFWRQVLLYSLVFLIFALGLICLTFVNLQDVSRNYISLSQYSQTGTAMLQTDIFLDSMLRTATQVSHDTEVISIMRRLHSDTSGATDNHFLTNRSDWARMTEILSSHNTSEIPVWRISVYNTTGDYVCSTDNRDALELGSAATQDPAFLAALTEYDTAEYVFLGPNPDPYSTDTAEYLSLILPIKSISGLDTYGYVEVQQAASDLSAHLEPYVPEKLQLFLFYDRDKERDEQIYPADLPYPADQLDAYYKTEHLSEYGWNIVMLRDRSTLMDDFKPLITVVLTGILALYALLLICVYLIARYTNKPIVQLNEKVKQVTLDHIPDQPVTAQATDEVRELYHSFDLMVQRLNTSFQLEKKAYLKALQAQMNPHFLYNCLSTISGMSMPPYNEQIPTFCNRLAAILRYETVYDDKPVTLADELNNIRNYLDLMKLRHESDFEYQIDADESLLDLPMPRLVLQPLTENCFEHGFHSVAPPWHVQIRIFREERHWCITIQDNGCGFDEEKRLSLLHQVDELMANLGENYAELKIGGLGLVNTIARLRLVTDDQLYYSITPNQPTGTIVTLKGSLHD